MASRRVPRDAERQEGGIDAVRAALPELSDDDLVEQRPADRAPEEAPTPLHDPWWAPV